MTIRPAAVSTARNWWLRSPNPSNANNVRNVNSDGSLNNNNAYNGNSAAADCEMSEHKVIRQRRTKSKHSHRERQTFSERRNESRGRRRDPSRSVLSAPDAFMKADG